MILHLLLVVDFAHLCKEFIWCCKAFRNVMKPVAWLHDSCMTCWSWTYRKTGVIHWKEFLFCSRLQKLFYAINHITSSFLKRKDILGKNKLKSYSLFWTPSPLSTFLKLLLIMSSIIQWFLKELRQQADSQSFSTPELSSPHLLIEITT